VRSVSGDHYDRDNNECRDQRKGVIECFRSGLYDIVEWRHGLRWRSQFANEPANISRLHWIRRYSDFFDMIAFGAIERAKFESCRPRRDARKQHARSAFRAAETLNCEQWNCGQMIAHCIPPLGQAGAQNSQSPVGAEKGGDGTSMLFRVPRRWSISLTFKKLMN
jgi:hypothetical protein